jgi:hypothetical protein
MKTLRLKREQLQIKELLKVYRNFSYLGMRKCFKNKFDQGSPTKSSSLIFKKTNIVKQASKTKQLREKSK